MSEPQRPQALLIGEVTHNTIELTWGDKLSSNRFAPKITDDEDKVKYVVQEEEVVSVNSRGFGTVYSGYKTSHVFQGLEPKTLYRYKVRAMNAYGVSPWSPVAEVTTKKQPPSSEDLHRAVQAGDIRRVKRVTSELHRDLLDAPDKYGNTPLMSAAQKGLRDVAAVLLEAGSDVNYQNSSGKSSLMVASFAGQLEVAKLLHRSKADLSARDKTGSTVMHWAVDGRNLELMHWLISSGCEVNSKDHTSGWTPLMRLAATNGDIGLAKALILHGADVNILDVDKKSVLMVAALNGHFELVQLLVSRGANITARSGHGKTAIDFARSFEHKDVHHYLEQELQSRSKTEP